MIQKIKNVLRQLVDKASFNKLREEVIKLHTSNGKILSELNLLHKRDSILQDVKNAEFQVFSQWGDDGIINFLVNYLDIENKKFVEFGVENYTECNTRFLLVNDNWSGLIIDGSPSNIESVQKENIYWKYDLTAICQFVTKENINELLSKNNMTGEIGLLHIDIDGNDYWIWNEINVVNPVIVIVEYNSVFGVSNSWTTPYDAAFYRTNAHHSNLYYGSSLLSLCDLAKERGYSFIGCNSNGNNAYFVRNDKMKKLAVKTPEEGFVTSKFAESRDANGTFTYLRGDQRLSAIKGCKVYNTRKGSIETI